MFLKSLPVQVDFAERDGKDGALDGAASFAAPPGYSVDPARGGVAPTGEDIQRFRRLWDAGEASGPTAPLDADALQ